MHRHHGARAVATFNASPNHEPKQAANYGDGWHLSHAPRPESAHAGLKHETSPAHSPRCAKGWQDIRAGSAHSEDRA